MKEAFVFSGEASELASVRARLRDFLNQAGIGEGDSGRIVLAIDEACTNIIRHAHRGEAKPVELRMERREESLEFVLEDNGEPCDPEKIAGRPLAEVRPGGLGLHIIREVFDVVDYSPLETGMRLTLGMRIQRDG